MHKFRCKAQSGIPVPTEPSKKELFARLLKDYEDRDITFTIAIEVSEKNINQEQEQLYKAYILKAADHFGTDFHDMEKTLYNLMPEKPRSRWSTRELNDFISKSNSYLAEFGFHF